MVMIVAVDS